MPGKHAAPIARPHARAPGASLALLALALFAPLASQAACHVKVAGMPVHMVGSRVMTSLGINGQDVPMMVDTGAFYSFLSDGAAAQLKLSTWRAPEGLQVQGLAGRTAVRVATVKKLKLLKGTMSDVEFLVGGSIARSRLGDLAASKADLAAARKISPTIVEDLQRLGLSEGQLPVRP